MRPKLRKEIERLKQILSSHGLEFLPVDGATNQQIRKIENETDVELDPDLRAFYQFTNGSDRATWFAVMSDQLTPCLFPDLNDALEAWSWFLPYDQSTYEEWSDTTTPRDGRIQPGYLHHRAWFPIAEFNGYSTSIYFDADPTDKGQYGQIIVYQHDP